LTNLQNSITQLTLDGNDFGTDNENGDKLDDIGELTKLRKLSIQDSNIKQLTYDLFDNLDDLIVLKLARNKIVSVDDDTFEWNPLKLEIVDMSKNQIRYIQHFLFYDLTSLQEINLSENKIAFVHPHAFQKLTQLRRLNLSKNHLHTFNPMWVRPLKNAGLQTLDFSNNPWSCDCSNEASRDFLNENYWVMDLIDRHPLVCKATDEQLGLFNELKKFQNKKLTDTKDKLPCNPPRIVGISKSSTIEAGKSVLLKCIAQGLPQPSISWIAPDQDVYRFNNNNYEGVEVNEEGNLKITDLAKTDQGDYICQATNFQSSEEDEDDEDDENDNSGSNVAQVKMTLTIVQDDNDDSNNNIEDFDIGNQKINPDSDEHETFNTRDHCPTGCTCANHMVDCTYPPYDSFGNSRPLTKFPDMNSNKIDKSLKDFTKDYYLDGNELTKVPSKVCSPFASLEELRLEANQISTIDKYAWDKCDKLMMLSLRDNRLTVVTNKMFSGLPRLENLILDENDIQVLNAQAFSNMPKLRWLYIRKTKLHTVNSKAFYKVPQLEFLHFEDNQLSYLPTGWFNTLKEDCDDPKVFLSGNPVNCDCSLKDFYKKEEDYDDLVDFYEISCAYPARNRGYTLEELKIDELTCEAGDERPEFDHSITDNEEAVNRFGAFFSFFIMCIVGTGGYFLYQRWRQSNGYSNIDHSPSFQHLSTTYEDAHREINAINADTNPLTQSQHNDQEVYA